MGAKPNRPMPRMDPDRYKTYAVVSPLATHFRKATCEETDCPHFLKGWAVRVENCTPDLLHAARTSGRRFREVHVSESENWLAFEAGQKCFRASTHYLPQGRPPLFLVRGGDHRTTRPGAAAGQQLSAQTWVDDFAEHTQHLADEIAKG